MHHTTIRLKHFLTTCIAKLTLRFPKDIRTDGNGITESVNKNKCKKQSTFRNNLFTHSTSHGIISLNNPHSAAYFIQHLTSISDNFNIIPREYVTNNN